jgi:pantetheine-phosphate adenylyltransferase
MQRASQTVDELVVAVLENHAKIALFSVEERVKMLKIITKDYPNVRVESFHGLLVDFAREQGAGFIIRGLRAITDFDYELQMAQTNRIMAPGVDTIFFATNLEYAYLSSTTVREVASYGGDITKFVPESVARAVEEKIKDRYS